MKRDVEQLKKGEFDVLIIGAGINGCAIARDAALRGLKAALIEKYDFSSGASGKTTKLIHGGIRYLEQFNFKLIYEALHERAILLRTIPHLVKPLEFLMPVYKGDPRSLLKIRTGVFIYDKLAGKDKIRSHRILNKDEILAHEPHLDPVNLKGAAVYYDAQMDDARLCVDTAISACEAGCCAANKVEAVGFVKQSGKITGVEVKDRLTGEKFLIRAQIVVNATGAWSNAIVKMDEPEIQAITRPTKGVHIVYKKLPCERGIIFSAKKDKRVLFVIPWHGVTLIGTTDTDFSDSSDEVYAESCDIEYLLNEARRIFPDQSIDKSGIIATYAGLRPLVNTQGKLSWQVSREHLIKESASGLMSVVGGKYTTYRHLAQQLVDILLTKFKERKFKFCITQEIGPTSSVAQGQQEDLRTLIERAVKEEMAIDLVDLMIRRLEFSIANSLTATQVQECAQIMAGFLGWSSAQQETQIQLYKEEVRKNMECIA